MNKRTKLTDSKLFWAVISLLISLVFWTYVTQQDNSTITRTFSEVQVIFTGEDQLESAGLAIADVDTKEVSVTLRGSRRVMGRLDSSKINAVIDVGNITQTGEMRWSYYLKYTGIGNDDNNITVVSRTPETISFSISELKSKTIDIKAEYAGTTAYGFYSKDPTVTPSSINVSGSSSILQNIAGAKVVIYGDNISESLKDTVATQGEQFILLDDSGNEMDKTGLSFSEEYLEVEVPVSNTKQIPLKVTVDTGGSISEEYCDVEITPSKVEVSGDPEVLNGIDSIDLGTVQLDGYGDAFENTYEIVYPDGVTSVDNVKEAKVKVTIQGLDVRDFVITDISFSNIPNNMSVEPTGDLSILLRGPSDKLSEISESNLHASADLSNVPEEEGSVTVPVTVTCDVEDVAVVGTYEITVTIENNT